MLATQINPIVAIAAQAKSAEDRATAARRRAARMERQRAAFFRRRASTTQTTGAKSLPAVATIH